jgi:16S rRNA (guanine527-N7)-methyltransferase
MIDPELGPGLAEVSGRSVSRETVEVLERFVALIRSESQRQNLVSASSLAHLWDRHILDSAQLVRFEPAEGSAWLDIGSGAGFPGLVIAALVTGPVVLVEPRRLRAEFLARAITELCLGSRVSVAASTAEKLTGRFAVITARAVAPLDRLLGISTHLSTRKSIWVLPKGQSAQSELVEARRNWHCEATTVPSLTDPASRILLLRNVRPRGGR